MLSSNYSQKLYYTRNFAILFKKQNQTTIHNIIFNYRIKQYSYQFCCYFISYLQLKITFIPLPKSTMNFIDVVKDTLCGTASGIAQVFTMVPLENIITKMINKPQQYHSFIPSFIKTIKQEGPLSFYKGMLMPLLGVGFQVSLQFGVVETFKKIMKNNYANEQGKLSMLHIMICGVFASFPSALTVTPLDQIRYRVLMNKSNDGPGSAKLTLQILKRYGVRKLFLGFNITFFKEAIGLSTYFGIYHEILQILQGNKVDLTYAAFYAGGIAGVLSWLLTYPLHVVKVKVQSDDLVNPKYKSSIQCITQMIKNKQLAQAYRGVQWMLVRAFLVNGVGFVSFQQTKKFLYKNQL